MNCVVMALRVGVGHGDDYIVRNYSSFSQGWILVCKFNFMKMLANFATVKGLKMLVSNTD